MSASVVRLITRLNIGGPAIQALLLTRELRDDFPTVLGAGHAPASEGELSHPEVLVERLPLVRPVRPISDLQAIRATKRLLERERPQILHTHMAKAGAVGRIAALKASSQPKTIHTFHGHVLEGYFGRRIERAFVAVERGLARRTDVLVAISDEVRDSLLYRGIGKPGQWRVIPLGFDLDPFLHVSTPTMELRNSLGVRRDTPLIGVIGRLAPVKDHATLLEALEHLPGVHLAILGDGESRASIERRIKSGSLQGRVHMVGWWLDIADALADLDVVVLSSINEGTPVSLIEALASARPVVATDVGGVRSVVDDGDTGFLVGGADPRALAAEVQRLLSDRDLRAAFGERGRQAMVDRFSKTRLLSDIRTLYEELSS